MILRDPTARVNLELDDRPHNTGDPAIDCGSRPFDHLAKALMASGAPHSCKGEDAIPLTPAERNALLICFRLQTGREVGYPTLSFSLGKWWVSNERCGHAHRAYLVCPTPKTDASAQRADDLHDADVAEKRAARLRQKWGQQ